MSPRQALIFALAICLLGMAILLFLVGLKLDLTLIRSLGAVSVTTGLGQVVFLDQPLAWICLWLGLLLVDWRAACWALAGLLLVVVLPLNHALQRARAAGVSSGGGPCGGRARA